MTRKKPISESSSEQSERFRQTVRDLVAAGELDPTEADKAFEKAMSVISRKKSRE